MHLDPVFWVFRQGPFPMGSRPQVSCRQLSGQKTKLENKVLHTVEGIEGSCSWLEIFRRGRKVPELERFPSFARRLCTIYNDPSIPPAWVSPLPIPLVVLSHLAIIDITHQHTPTRAALQAR